jgi:hypothetical protein
MRADRITVDTMTAIVLCGDANTAPDHVFGPFQSLEEADEWARGQPGQPARYAVAMPVTPPE